MFRWAIKYTQNYYLPSVLGLVQLLFYNTHYGCYTLTDQYNDVVEHTALPPVQSPAQGSVTCATIDRQHFVTGCAVPATDTTARTLVIGHTKLINAVSLKADRTV